ncbi:MAG: helix-turn-helix domain-containing protein, partial [Gemmataceae bacterium]
MTLTEDERAELARSGRAAYKITHARILLKADAAAAGPGWQDEQIADALGVGTATVERLRRRSVEDGLQAALGRKEPASRKPPLLDGAAEARLVALACSAPPLGRACWTLKLLANRLVE